ncbi:mitochondrial enolase superfamily member 1 [Grus japonensis]|uniref:Mitochondrial enolase superfamily member 1 n=1 Tax=Grus japonensis TaxID=30415 RepID=A0ABC9WY41_GRUJA
MGGKGRDWETEELPTVGEDQVQEYLRNPKVHKPMGPDEMHLQVLRELADEVGHPDTTVIDELETMEGHVGIRASPLKKVMRSVAQLKCIYTNACSMGNKQRELEAIIQQETVIELPSWKHGGTIRIIELLQGMATNS